MKTTTKKPFKKGQKAIDLNTTRLVEIVSCGPKQTTYKEIGRNFKFLGSASRPTYDAVNYLVAVKDGLEKVAYEAVRALWFTKTHEGTAMYSHSLLKREIRRMVEVINGAEAEFFQKSDVEAIAKAINDAIGQDIRDGEGYLGLGQICPDDFRGDTFMVQSYLENGHTCQDLESLTGLKLHYDKSRGALYWKEKP